MSPFSKIKRQFGVNWTTVLVGWKGFGPFSPWPARPADFPPLLSADELAEYAHERLVSDSSVTERTLLGRLLRLDPHTENPQVICDLLAELSAGCGADGSRELRKWQVVLLEELLEQLPTDPVYGLITLTEFWQNFGFPPDSPHEIQGERSALGAQEYYEEDNYRRLIARHKAWINDQKPALVRN